MAYQQVIQHQNITCSAAGIFAYVVRFSFRFILRQNRALPLTQTKSLPRFHFVSAPHARNALPPSSVPSHHRPSSRARLQGSPCCQDCHAPYDQDHAVPFSVRAPKSFSRLFARRPTSSTPFAYTFRFFLPPRFMLLDFGVEIRSCDRLEVGRNLKSDEHHDISQQNIMLNWQFAETLFPAIDPEPNKAPNCGAHLLPTCYNFEFEGCFSTT